MKTKLLATLAVLAMAFAGVAVLTDMEQDDAAASTYAPGAYAIGTNNLRVISYVDQVLLVDTNAMAATALSNYTDFYVKIEVGTSSGTYTADSTVIGPLSLQNGKIYIDANIITTTNKFAKVSLFGYGQNLSSDTALDSATFEYTETAATLSLHANHAEDWTTVNDDNTGAKYSTLDYSDVSIARNTGYKADESLKVTVSETATAVFDGSDYGYTLTGWAVAYNGTVALNKTDSTDDEDKVSIEDIIFVAGAITSNKVTLYAIYEKTVYNIYVYDEATSGYVQTEASIKSGSDVVAKATASTKVEGASFGLLRIAQDSAKAGQYAYTVTLYKDNTSADDKKVKADGSEGSYTFLENGTYRLNVTKNDLYVKVTAAASANVTPTAYSFGIDSISNKTGVGVVDASLDLFDYAITGNEHVKFEGTYYKAATTDGQRIYGNIANLAAGNTVYTMSVDNGAYAATGQLYAALDDDDPHAAYDVKLTLGTGISFYAAKGIFDVDSTETEDANNAVTPWSLVTA